MSGTKDEFGQFKAGLGIVFIQENSSGFTKMNGVGRIEQHQDWFSVFLKWVC